ncbi:MAG: S6e family ribosomal protein [Candidatus Bathyarchaeia archaeon]
MAKFVLVVSDPRSGKSKSYSLEGDKTVPLVGKEIGDSVDGSVIGLPKGKIRITGGTDKDGFPMLPSVSAGVKKRIILSKGRAHRSTKRQGQRKAKMIRGRMITEDIYQINATIVEEKGKKRKPSKASRKSKK